MAERQVTKTGKDRDGDIIKLCGDFGEVYKAQAIREIKFRTHRYFVDEGWGRVYVKVVPIRGVEHLRTAFDSTIRNNLDNLPDC